MKSEKDMPTREHPGQGSEVRSMIEYYGVGLGKVEHTDQGEGEVP